MIGPSLELRQERDLGIGGLGDWGLGGAANKEELDK